MRTRRRTERMFPQSLMIQICFADRGSGAPIEEQWTASTVRRTERSGGFSKNKMGGKDAHGNRVKNNRIENNASKKHRAGISALRKVQNLNFTNTLIRDRHSGSVPSPKVDRPSEEKVGCVTVSANRFTPARCIDEQRHKIR